MSSNRLFLSRHRSSSDVEFTETPIDLLECAVIMLHRDVQQVEIALRQCRRLGLLPIVIPLPTYHDDAMAYTSIKILNQYLAMPIPEANLKTPNLKYFLVEANYSYRGSPNPNSALLAYISKHVDCNNIFAFTNTEPCLKKINESYPNITTTQNFVRSIYEFIEKDPSTQRKYSLNI